MTLQQKWAYGIFSTVLVHHIARELIPQYRIRMMLEMIVFVHRGTDLKAEVITYV